MSVLIFYQSFALVCSQYLRYRHLYRELISVVMTVISDRFSARVLLGYYCTILLLVGMFQNIAVTKDYGFVWHIGNTLVQIAVLSYCLYDLLHKKTSIKKEYINKKRLWVVIPMLLAFLMPYSVDMHGVVRPSFTLSVLWNEAGLTYCMITPVIIGIMLIYSEGIYKPVMSVISYVGLVFGLLNMMTWFGIQNENRWMGVLHFPLLILSFYGLVVAKKERQFRN